MVGESVGYDWSLAKLLIAQVPDGSPPILPAPGTCPLCFVELDGEDEEVWMKHLLSDGCSQNPRKYGVVAG